MAFEEYIKKAISTGLRYDKLPERVRATLSLGEYKNRVREYCIRKGLPWNSSMAREVSTEQEYYDDLVRTYKTWARLYPYHLSDYIARVLRVTPFRYYSDVLFMMLKDERSYDRIPNFTAADALRVTGVGRNEYIAIMNACKAKKLMWRVNKGLARDLLPATPLDIRMEGWWIVNVVNVGEAEFRDLSPAGSNLLRQACEPTSAQQQQQVMAPLIAANSSSNKGATVSSFDISLLQQLYKRGLIYLDVPVAAGDKLSVPPLEGFVSNKTSEVGDESVDPFEPLLYNLFLANSSRLDQARLADILGVELHQLLLATSIAIRLGFATRLSPGSSGAVDELGAPLRGLSVGTQGGSQALTIPDSDASTDGAAAAGTTAINVPSTDAAGDNNSSATGVWEDDTAGDESEGAVAVVVDAEATSYLMMGALSPGLKRHSVTLFEGGRVGGAAVMDELISELAASAAADAQFEGEMVQLMRHIQSLGILLSVIRSSASSQGHQLELLRKESLEGLDPARAAVVLSHAYSAIIPIAPMPGAPLPINPLLPSSPTLFGPTAAADSPWLQLALYSAAACGPVSLVVPAGRRVRKLPAQLEGVTHALLWGWSGAPVFVEGTGLLCSLNEMLCRTAVMVQPLVYNHQLPDATAADSSPLVKFVDIPLPLCPITAKQQQQQQQTPTGASWDPFGSSASVQTNATEQNNNGSAASLANDVQASTPVSQSPILRSQSSTDAIKRSSSTGSQQQQQQEGRSSTEVLAIDRQCDQLRRFVVPGYIEKALQELQLTCAVGWMRLVQLPATNSSNRQGAQPVSSWLPLTLHLGVPLFCPLLCQQICSNMAEQQCLTAAGQTAWRSAQQHMQHQLMQLVNQYSVNNSNSSKSSSGKLDSSSISNSNAAAMSQVWQDVVSGSSSGGGSAASDVRGVEPPVRSLLFDGLNLVAVHIEESLQGQRLW